MKIVFVCDTLGAGGAERVISTLSNEFVDRGHEVSIILMANTNLQPFYELNERVNVILLIKKIGKKVGFIKKTQLLRKRIKEISPNIVISFLSYVCIYTWLALKNTKIPYIVSERNDPNQRASFKQFLLNKSFKSASGCVFQTFDTSEWYKKIIRNKYAIIYNPVNLTFIPNKVDNRKEEILYVGRFSEQKNVLMLLEAFKSFKENHRQYSLSLYGNGPLKSEIESYIKLNGLQGSVSLKPNSNDWQQKEYTSKLFVLPSKFEGMPNVLSEALCLGILSVSTNCSIGGPKELKKIFPTTLILADDMSSLSLVRAMEKGIKINCEKPYIPEELNAKNIADKWIDFINQVK